MANKKIPYTYYGIKYQASDWEQQKNPYTYYGILKP